jgi:hypothetical protein
MEPKIQIAEVELRVRLSVTDCLGNADIDALGEGLTRRLQREVQSELEERWPDLRLSIARITGTSSTVACAPIDLGAGAGRVVSAELHIDDGEAPLIVDAAGWLAKADPDLLRDVAADGWRGPNADGLIEHVLGQLLAAQGGEMTMNATADRPTIGDKMPKEIDFSKGARGRFYRDGARFILPVRPLEAHQIAANDAAAQALRRLRAAWGSPSGLVVAHLPALPAMNWLAAHRPEVAEAILAHLRGEDRLATPMP